MEALDIVTIVSAGMLIGVEFTISAFVNPILGRLDRRAEAEATRLFAQVLGRVMPFWYGFCLLTLVAESLFRRQTSGFTLLTAASALWAAVIALTLLFLVPINNRIAKMDADGYGDELRRQHRRWDRMHRGRVFLLFVAFVCVLLAISV